MAIDKVTSASIATDAVGPTQLNEASNYDFTGTVTGAGGVNTPAFLVGQTSNQTISNETWTLLSWDSEDFDIGSGFDLSNNKFVVPSGAAGKYHFTVWVTGNNTINYDRFHTAIWVNGSTPTFAGAGSRYTNHPYPNLGSGNFSGSNSFLYNASVGDYFEVKLYQDAGGDIVTNASRTWFYGYKIIE